MSGFGSGRGMAAKGWSTGVGALATVLALAGPAWADEGGGGPGDKAAALFLLACVTVVPLALFPLGLAFHGLLRAWAPRRTRQLVHAIERRGTRTLVLGAINTTLLVLVFLGAAKRADALALFALFVLVGLGAIGSHGVARSLGARIVGEPVAELGARSELRELALGWFVLAYVGSFPFLGWAVGVVWMLRAVGGVVFVLFFPDPLDEPLEGELARPFAPLVLPGPAAGTAGRDTA